MASPRRIAGPDAKNRSALLDAAEQLMLDEGYAAVSSRRVATQANLKPQLVHYYFRTMDDLFLAVFQRRAEEGLQRQARALASEQPLRALWEFSTEAMGTALTMEFVALSNHRKSIRAEIARYAEAFRVAQVAALAEILEQRGISPDRCPPDVLAVLISCLSRFIVMEQALGMSSGHSETLAIVEQQLQRFEAAPIPGPQ